MRDKSIHPVAAAVLVSMGCCVARRVAHDGLEVVDGAGQLVTNISESVECTLILMSEWETILPTFLANRAEA